MSRSVLLIDSDKTFERQLAAELAELQIEVTPLPVGKDVIAHIAATSPIAVVIAVEEPDKAGFLMCNRAKKGPAAAIPVVMVTKSVSENDFAAHRKLKVHADRYFDKRTLAPGVLTATFHALLADGVNGDDGDDFDIIADFTSTPDVPTHAGPLAGDGVVEEQEFIVESGEFEAVDQFESLLVGRHTGEPRGANEQRTEDEAFAALGNFSDDDAAEPASELAGLPDVKTAVAHGFANAGEFGNDYASGESEFSQDLATNFDTDNVIDAIDQQDSLAIPMGDAARSTIPPPVRRPTAPPPFRHEPPRASTNNPIAAHAPLFGAEQEFQGGSDQALEIEAIPEAVPTPNRPLQSDRFDLGLDEVAAWATEEKSQISDRKALSRLSDLERENERLASELDRARSEAQERNNESARVYLRDQSQELALRVTQLEEELRQTKASLTSYEAAIQAKEGAIAELEAIRMASEAALADATARLLVANQRANEANAQAQRVSAQLDEQQQMSAAAQIERDRAAREAAEEFQAALAANAELHESALAKLQEELAAAQLAAQRALQPATLATAKSDHAKILRAKKAVAIALTILDEES